MYSYLLYQKFYTCNLDIKKTSYICSFNCLSRVYILRFRRIYVKHSKGIGAKELKQFPKDFHKFIEKENMRLPKMINIIFL